ncbi:MAG: hypothetical protein ACREJD_02200 [Phycisphaerales bacterium]
MKLCGAFLFVALVGASPVQAQAIPIANAGFEDGAISPCSFRGFIAATDVWMNEFTSNAGVWKPSTCWDLSAPEGVQVAYSNSGTGTQILPTKALPAATYTLSALVGSRNHACCSSVGAVLELWAGATKIGVLNLGPFDVPPKGTWARKTLVATTPPGLPANQNLIIRFRAIGAQQDFDDFSLVLGGADCPGDINGDGQVDDADFTLFAAAYNLLVCSDPAMPSGCPADLNHDDIVDDSDFTIFVVGYNTLVCP